MKSQADALDLRVMTPGFPYENYHISVFSIVSKTFQDVGQDGSSGMLGDSQPGSGSGMIGDETQYSTISSGENADTDKNENGVSSTNHDDQTVVNKKYKITINSLHPFTNTDLVKRNNIKKVVISRGLGQKKMWVSCAKLFMSVDLCYRYTDDFTVFEKKKFLDYLKEIYQFQLTVEKDNKCFFDI